MIKFLILCTSLLLLYLGFSVIGEYDSQIQLSVFDYQIESTLFAFIAIFIIVQFAFMFIFKIIFLMFNMPSLLKKRWQDRKLVHTNKKLLIVLAELLMGNRKKSIVLTNKLVSDLNGENQEVINLIRAEAEEGFDKKIQYLRNLLDKKYYSIYAALGSWHKLAFVVSKLKRSSVKLLRDHSEEVASFYYAAAKATLQSGEDEKAMEYLESSLELYPGYVAALNLFMELSVNINNTSGVLKVLRVAFSSAPCFEIARMYADTSRSSAEAIYGTLAGMTTPIKYPDLFLALAAYLGLSNKIISANDGKSISSEVVSK